MSLNWLRPGRSRMLREPPQGRGFGVNVRLKTMSLRQLRMIRGTVFQSGRGWLGDCGWEESIDQRVGQAGDKMSWPKQMDTGLPILFGTPRFHRTCLHYGLWHDMVILHRGQQSDDNHPNGRLRWPSVSIAGNVSRMGEPGPPLALV